MAVLFMGSALYYWAKVRNNADYLTQRNYRLLSTASRQVQELTRMVGRMASRDVQGACGAALDKPGSSTGNEEDPCQRAITELEGRSRPGEIVHRIQKALDERLRDRQRSVTRGQGSRGTPAIEFEEYRLVIGARPGAAGCSAVVPRSTLGREEVPGRLLRVDEYQGARCTLSVETRARANLESVFKPFLAVFDLVAVLDERRRVLLSVPDSPLDVLLAPRAPSSSPSPPGNPPAGDGVSAVDRGDLAVPPRVETVVLADQQYLTFCQPLSGEKTPSLLFGVEARARMLCGLVKAERFHTEKVALNPYWLVAIGSFLALALLGWPLLKVLSLGQAERMRLSDLLFLALSLVASTALVTLLVLDLTSYLTVERVASAPSDPQDLESQLQHLADRVSTNLQAELEDLREMLFAFQDLTPEVVRRESKEPIVNITSSLPRLLDGSIPYPFFKSVTWIDESGWQRVKWTNEGRRGQLFNVRDRAYVRRVMDDQLWPANGRDRDRAGRFYLEPVQSRNSGELSLVLSTYAKPVTGDPKARWALALGAQPFSLVSPVLPPGFGFVLIDPNGQTLFHSGRDQLSEENFVEECDRNPRLRAAMLSHTSDVFAARYWGRDHLLSVSPLRDLPLVLVAFVDKHLVRTVHLELLSLCLMALAALLTAVAFWGGLARALTGRGGERWLWPCPSATSRYLALAVLSLAAGFELFRSASDPSEAGLRLLKAFGLPLAVVGLMAVLLGRRRLGGRRRYVFAGVLVGIPLGSVTVAALARNDFGAALGPILLLLAAFGLVKWPDLPRPSWTEHPAAIRRAYVAWALAGLLTVAVAPAYAFFRVTWERQARLFVQHGQLELARKLDERERTLPRGGGVFAPEGRCEPGRIGRGAHGRCMGPTYDALYASAFHGTVIEDAVGDDPRGTSLPHAEHNGREPRWLESLTERLPFYNSSSVLLRGMCKSRAEDGEWHSSFDSGRARLTLVVRRAREKAAYKVESMAPRFGVMGHPAPWLALAVGALVMAGLVRFLLRRFFLLDFREPETVSYEELSRQPLDAHLFVVCPCLGCSRVVRSRPDVVVVDLGGAHPLQALKAPVAQSQVFCLDRFELALADPATRQALLEVLESSIDASPRPFLILSEIEPEEVVAAAGHDDEARRWTRLLGRFARIIAVDPGDPDGFEAALRAAETEARGRYAGKPDSATRIALHTQLLATVRKECSRHRQLQSLGRALLDLPDFAQHEPERLVRHLRERADGFYRALWTSLSSDEKLLLTRVASGHLVNPRCGRTLSRLLARRLIVPDAGFRLVNRSFARFVMSEARPEEVAAWEQSAAVSPWAQMRMPVMISLSGVAAFLAFTQGDTLSSSLTAVGAAVPILVKIFDLVRSAPALASVASTVGRANA